MLLVLLGAAACYGAMTALALLIKTEDWWAPHPTAWAAVLTLGVVPLAAAWVGAEVVRVVRSPRVLTGHAHPLKRLLTGLTVGLAGSGLGALAVVLMEPARGGFAWLLMGGGSLVASLSVLWCARRAARGRCARCDYDLAGVTVAAAGRCPECGLDVMGAG
ncbi:MAG: hypothetical protein K2Q09_00695 [Phycisphaerales bacterium]|nr:hypothetical protein [Phycisphaerales bacterium]